VKHVAIDLGGRESQICIRDAAGAIVEERRYQTRLLPRLMKSWEPSRVIIETSAEAFAIADAALAVGHQVRVVPATLVKTLGVGDRGVKTDRKDARKLSEVSCRIDLPSVHVPSELARRLKSVCGNREELVVVLQSSFYRERTWGYDTTGGRR
jgi:transposase